MTPTATTSRLPITRVIICLLGACVCCGCPKSPNSTVLQRTAIPSAWICIPSVDQAGDAANEDLKGLTRKDAEMIAATIPTAQIVLSERFGKATAKHGTREVPIQLSGTSSDYFELLHDDTRAEIVQGRFLTAVDLQTPSQVVVIKRDLAQSLFQPETAVGNAITIGRQEFTVVGVLDDGAPSMVRDVKRDAYIPLTTFDVDNLRIEQHSETELDRIWVEVQTLDQAPATREIIVNLIGKYHSDGDATVR